MCNVLRPYEDWDIAALKEYEERLYDDEVNGEDVWFERDQVLWELAYRDGGTDADADKRPS